MKIDNLSHLMRYSLSLFNVVAGIILYVFSCHQRIKVLTISSDFFGIFFSILISIIIIIIFFIAAYGLLSKKYYGIVLSLTSIYYVIFKGLFSVKQQFIYGRINGLVTIGLIVLLLLALSYLYRKSLQYSNKVVEKLPLLSFYIATILLVIEISLY